MAEKRVVVNTCDLCGRDDTDPNTPAIATHQIGLDGLAVELEACGDCWAKPKSQLASLFDAGRRAWFSQDTRRRPKAAS